MVFLLDTSVLSRLIVGDVSVESRLAALRSPNHEVMTCTIARGELTFGIHRLPQGKRRRTLQDNATKIFEHVPCEPIWPEVADEYARLKTDLERRGIPLDENDLWIAATALALGATLVTRDADFQRISGLLVEDWSAQ
jgi:tRNA(fMet)-specific endonuclease VapC